MYRGRRERDRLFTSQFANHPVDMVHSTQQQDAPCTGLAKLLRVESHAGLAPRVGGVARALQAPKRFEHAGQT